MTLKKTFSLMAILMCILLLQGCEGDSDSEDSSSSGSYAGTWRGNVCGRGLTMILNQSGTSLSGSYALTNPDFGENLSGAVSSLTTPASAILYGGGDRRFEITFNSHNSFSGGFYKGSTMVCSATATK